MAFLIDGGIYPQLKPSIIFKVMIPIIFFYLVYI